MAWSMYYHNNDYEITTGSCYDSKPLVSTRKGAYNPAKVPLLVKMIEKIFEVIHTIHRGKHITFELTTPPEICGEPQYMGYGTDPVQTETVDEILDYPHDAAETVG